jgi:hypothetical protein
MREKRLGVRQLDMLRGIVKRNGAGLYIFGAAQEKVMRSLERQGLIQGKSGQEFLAVHTRAGLDLIRKLDAPE